jgi:glycine receptor alpha-3
LKLFFVRSLGYYIIQIYIPSTLIVVLSWVSFWLDRTAAPARVSLGITTVLTMVTFIWSTNASLPKISYVKGIDVYLVCCFFMTFSSVIEYAMVSYVHMRFERKKRKKNALLQEVQQQNELSKQLIIMRNSSAQLVSSNRYMSIFL